MSLQHTQPEIGAIQLQSLNELVKLGVINVRILLEDFVQPSDTRHKCMVMSTSTYLNLWMCFFTDALA